MEIKATTINQKVHHISINCSCGRVMGVKPDGRYVINKKCVCGYQFQITLVGCE